jgi:hypothetical protein
MSELECRDCGGPIKWRPGTGAQRTRCTDCALERRRQRINAAARLRYAAEVLPRRLACVCEVCGEPVGAAGTWRFCGEHSTHRSRSRAAMQLKRAALPEYREDERNKVRDRMRRLRSDPGYVRPEQRHR